MYVYNIYNCNYFYNANYNASQRTMFLWKVAPTSSGKKLTSLIIPASVTEIGQSIIYSCENCIITVEEGSYAAQYCKENKLDYTYPDSLDWLNN